MTPIEIYKLLPKTNCGDCAQKTCMAFALYVKTNPEGIKECKHVAVESIEKIGQSVVQKDWKDGLIKDLSAELAVLDFPLVAEGLGARVADGNLVIRCIGADYTIAKDGTVTPDRGNKWINILLLHYIRSQGKGDFSGRWASFSEFKGGLVKTSAFTHEAEEPLQELFDGNPEVVAGILHRLGAVPAAGFPADYALTLDLLPKVRVLILYRRADDEFPSSCKIAFDSITGNFLDVESIVFVCEGLVHSVSGMLRGSTGSPQA